MSETQWDIAARELMAETGARNIHLVPGTNPHTTVEQIKAEFYKALNHIAQDDCEKLP